LNWWFYYAYKEKFGAELSRKSKCMDSMTKLMVKDFVDAESQFQSANELLRAEITKTGNLYQKIVMQLKLSKIIAVVIKIIVAAGGLTMVIGPDQSVIRAMGILVAIAATYEGIFLNHKKLLAADEAATVYKLFLDSINFRMQSAILKCQQSHRDDPSSHEWWKDAAEVFTRMREDCFNTRTKIETALNEVNREALRALSIEAAKAELSNAPKTFARNM
jgi:hypothetical protein